MGVLLDKADRIVYPGSKIAAINVLAGLISDPLLFADRHYRFDISDFPEQFHRIVFGAVDHLAQNGMEKIGYLDIDQFLKPYAVEYKVFCDNRGIEYIQNALSMYNPKQFRYYYDELRKYSLLSTMKAQGIDVSDIYDPDILDPRKNSEMQRRFDALTVEEIVGLERNKIEALNDAFSPKSALSEIPMGENAKKLVDGYKETPMMGLPLVTPKLTTLYLGLRRGAYYIESAGTGVGKSRRMAGESCHLAYPEYYDTGKKEWINTGFSQKTLLISTELTHEEQQAMCLAYISGVEQNRFQLKQCSAEEWARLDRAAEIMEKYKDAMQFVPMTTYSIDDVLSVILKYHQLYHVDYVFFDYLMSNEELLAASGKRSRVVNLRTDQVLGDLSTALKELAKEENIMIWTATQMNGREGNNQDLFLTNQSLSDSKAVANKADDGAILMKVRDVDKQAINQWEASSKRSFVRDSSYEPNVVLHFYKMRNGKYAGTKLYLYFDRGTCRVYDCFATDSDGKIIQIEDTLVKIKIDPSDGAADQKSAKAPGSHLDAIRPAVEQIDGKNGADVPSGVSGVIKADPNGVIDDPLPDSFDF